MKKLDVLKKPDNFYTRKTLFGGVISLCVFFVTFLILVKEFKNFKQIKVNKNLYLDPKPVQEKIKVSLDILLRHCPCNILSLDVNDTLVHHQTDLPIEKIRINRLGEFVSNFNKAQDDIENYKNFIQDIDDQIGC